MKNRILPHIPFLLHGGDYNPEQWPRDVWDEDMRLMDKAGVNIATIGVFSWGELEPEEGRFEFGWLDDVVETLTQTGRVFSLATPSAAMPAWMSRKYPEILRTGADGVRRKHGNRVNFCWSSPVYREKVERTVRELAGRYGGHPGLAFWHVSNEYGGACHCSLCESRFREWLRKKFDNDLDALNEAYWTKFWSHAFRDWDEIEIPGDPYGETSMMGLSLDWRRFCTNQVIDFFLAESAPLREISPGVPVTTNLMGLYPGIDYHALVKHLDFVSWDSYPGFANRPLEATDWIGISFVHDLYRTFQDQPFLLIESTPEASNWYPVLFQKRPGMHRMEGLQAVAHGSEGVMYFQWRKSRGSAEQYHGAVVSHDGTDKTRVFRDVAQLGAELKGLEALVGTTKRAEVALVYDWENAWAIDLSLGPRMKGKDYAGTVVEQYRPFWEKGIPVDVVSSEGDFSAYKVVVAPMLAMLKPGVAERIREYVAGGGRFVATYWWGMIDENALTHLGGFPGGLRDVFGVWAEATDALHDGVEVKLKAVEGNGLGLSGEFVARQYCDLLQLEGAELLAEYASEFYAGTPAVTVHRYGAGEAYLVASRNDALFTDQFMRLLAERAGVIPVVDAELPEGVTCQMRTDGDSDYLVFFNVTPEPGRVVLGEDGLREVDGTVSPGEFELEGYGVKILVRSLAGMGTRSGDAFVTRGER